jgi:hypothetical protein
MREIVKLAVFLLIVDKMRHILKNVQIQFR